MIAKEIETSLNRSSWIRRVFDQGHELKKEFGAENVFDFSLGNPVVEPPKEFAAGIKSILEDNKKGKHRYMLNAGLDEVREYVAQELAEDFNLPIKKEQVVMTVGAGGALNVIFKSILNAGDEVLAFAPYFMEYEFYVSNHGGRLKVSKTDANFQPNLENFKKDLTYEVRAVLVNSPNNPTGVVYNQEKIDGIVKIIQEAEKIYGHPIYLISDEPYRSLIYDQSEQGSVLNAHEHSVLVTSHSKDYGLAGERIGYIAVNPLMKDWKKLIAGLIFSTRILGFVNAPALMQRVLPYLKTANTSKDHYQELRDITVSRFGL